MSDQIPELKPCPFCKSGDVEIRSLSRVIGGNAECRECAAEGPWADGPDWQIEAIASWNAAPRAEPITNSQRRREAALDGFAALDEAARLMNEAASIGAKA